MGTTFADVYERHILPALHRGVLKLKRASPNTQILVVPSLEEALSFHPLPQPPLDQSIGVQSGAFDKLKRAGVMLLSNPSHVKIGDLNVSISSADVLSPLLRDIICKPEGKKKIQESLCQVLRQRNLFPVLPRDPAAVSEARAAALNFPEGGFPDLCIFPSQCGGLSCSFVDETAFLNPGPVARPAALGGFAELWLTGGAEPSTSEDGAAPLSSRMRVDFHRLSE